MRFKSYLLVVFLMCLIFIIGCSEDLSDNELDSQLGKLSDEELDLVLTEEESALAGNAKYQQYNKKKTSKIRKLSRSAKKRSSAYRCTIEQSALNPDNQEVVLTRNGREIRRLPTHYCSRGNVRERYCPRLGGWYKTRIGERCDRGCENAMCTRVQECQRDNECSEGEVCSSQICQRVSCVDSDGGENPTDERGTVTVTRSISEDLVATDSCVDQHTVREFSCEADGGSWDVHTTNCPLGTRCNRDICSQPVEGVQFDISHEFLERVGNYVDIGVPQSNTVYIAESDGARAKSIWFYKRDNELYTMLIDGGSEHEVRGVPENSLVDMEEGTYEFNGREYQGIWLTALDEHHFWDLPYRDEAIENRILYETQANRWKLFVNLDQKDFYYAIGGRRNLQVITQPITVRLRKDTVERPRVARRELTTDILVNTKYFNPTDDEINDAFTSARNFIEERTNVRLNLRNIMREEFPNPFGRQPDDFYENLFEGEDPPELLISLTDPRRNEGDPNLHGRASGIRWDGMCNSVPPWGGNREAVIKPQLNWDSVVTESIYTSYEDFGDVLFHEILHLYEDGIHVDDACAEILRNNGIDEPEVYYREKQGYYVGVCPPAYDDFMQSSADCADGRIAGQIADQIVVNIDDIDIDIEVPME